MSFTFYSTFGVDEVKPYMPDVPVLLPASSWARRNLSKPRLPNHVSKRAADCGGFVATRIWGDYRYTPDEYVNWLYSWSPEWSATMDYCCEQPILKDRSETVYRRQDRTTEQAWHFWTTYRSCPWAWVPTVQGWEPEDYRRHARELKPLIEQMQAHYGDSSEWRVGIGTLCARDDVKTIRRVVNVVREELPGVPLHLWGLKLGALKTLDMRDIASSDSAAWHGQFSQEARQVTREAAQEAGISVREYVTTQILPDYIERVKRAVERPDVDYSDLKQAVSGYGWTLRLKTRGKRVYAYAVKRVNSKLAEIYLGLADTPDLTKLGIPTSPYTCPTLWEVAE